MFNPKVIGNEFHSDLIMVVRLITPEEAKAILDHNPDNPRGKTSHRHVLDYALAMEEGNWTLTGEPLIFDQKGNLKDGFHRLEASVLSGKSFPTLVVGNIEQSAIKDIDGGKVRTLSQRLGAEIHIVTLLSTAIYCFGYVHSQYKRRTMVQRLLSSPLARAANLMPPIKTGSTKYVGSAPFRIGLCLQHLNGTSADWINHHLRLVQLRQYDQLNQTMKALCRSIDTNSIQMPKGRDREKLLEIVGRAFKAFSPDNSHLNLIRVGDAEKCDMARRLQIYLEISF